MSDWELWKQEQIKKQDPHCPPRLKVMHSFYGVKEGEKCGDCKNFCRFDYHNKTYFKCDLTKITHGPKTDWRVNWVACGKFEKGE